MSSGINKQGAMFLRVQKQQVKTTTFYKKVYKKRKVKEQISAYVYDFLKRKSTKNKQEALKGDKLMINGFYYTIYEKGDNCQYCKHYNREKTLCSLTNLYVIGVLSCSKFKRKNERPKRANKITRSNNT